MGVLKEWFGKESIKSIPQNIRREIKLIESVLEETKDTKRLFNQNRIKSLRRIIEKQRSKGKVILKIENIITSLIKPYVKGKKDARKRGVSLTQILFLNRILKEFLKLKLHNSPLETTIQHRYGTGFHNYDFKCQDFISFYYNPINSFIYFGAIEPNDNIWS